MPGPSSLWWCLALFAPSFFLCLLSALAKPKEIAKDLDRSKQMMIAAKIFSPEGTFLLKDKEGQYVPAVMMSSSLLEPSSEKIHATKSQLTEMYKKRLIPKLVDGQGNITTFERAGIKEEEYTAEFKKSGVLQTAP